MSTIKKISDLTSASVDNSQEYAKHSWEYYKLKLFLHTAELSTNTIFFSVLTIIGLTMLLLLSIALAFFLGEEFQSLSFGFLTVGLLYFLILVTTLLLRKKIERFVVKKLSKTILDHE